MVKVNKLTELELQTLRKLCEDVKEADEEYKKFSEERGAGFMSYAKSGDGSLMLLTLLSLKENKKLIDFITEITKLPQEDVVSIHFIEYNVGSYTLDHLDSNSSNTVLFLLNSATKGGDLRVDGQLFNFKEEGSWVVYNGSNILHGVTEIEEGYRKVLVVWYGNTTWINKKSIL